MTTNLAKTKALVRTPLSKSLIHEIHVTAQLRDIVNAAQNNVTFNDVFGEISNLKNVIRFHKTTFIPYVCHGVISCDEQLLDNLHRARSYFVHQYPECRTELEVGAVLTALSECLNGAHLVRENVYNMIRSSYDDAVILSIDAEHLMRPEQAGHPIFVRDIYQKLAEALRESHHAFELHAADNILSRHLFREFTFQRVVGKTDQLLVTRPH